jgi:hypothetical protein
MDVVGSGVLVVGGGHTWVKRGFPSYLPDRVFPSKPVCFSRLEPFFL